MLGLPTKKTDQIDIFKPFMSNVSEGSGPQKVERVKSILNNLQNLRNNLINPELIVSNSTAVTKFEGEAKLYLSMWSCICKSFTFGNEKGSININFVWYDAVTKEKKSSSNPMIERIGMLYNLAVISNISGINIIKSPGSEYNEAAKKFSAALWFFERIKSDLINIRKDELTSDVSDRNIDACISFMKAHMQYCVYKQVNTKTPDKFLILSQLAMQAAKCYEHAEGNLNLSSISKAANAKSLLAIIQYNVNIFRARAYYWQSCEDFKNAKEKASGMGACIRNMQEASKYTIDLKKKEKSIPAEFKTEFNELYNNIDEKLSKCKAMNDKLYHEEIPGIPTEIVPRAFSKVSNMEAEIDLPFEGKEELFRMIPPGVRSLQEEYKRNVGHIVTEAFNILSEVNDFQVGIMTTYNLPAVLHGSNKEEKLPDELWNQIKECKEKGGLQGLTQLVAGVQQLSDFNFTNLNQLYDQIKGEEDEDKALKEKYGVKWTRVPSTDSNASIKKQIEHYLEKYQEGKKLDDQLKISIDSSHKEFELLEYSKETLTSMIPKCKSDSNSTCPSAIRYLWF